MFVLVGWTFLLLGWIYTLMMFGMDKRPVLSLLFFGPACVTFVAHILWGRYRLKWPWRCIFSMHAGYCIENVAHPKGNTYTYGCRRCTHTWVRHLNWTLPRIH
jgi:hypothetical protein